MTDLSGHSSIITSPARDSLLLVLDTSGPAGTVALARGETMLAERRFDCIRNTRRCCCRHSRSPGGSGSGRTGREHRGSLGRPGSFTGLRVGVMCAKTLAYATGARLVAIGTLAAISRTVLGDAAVHRGVWVVENAQRGDVFALHVPKGTVPFGDAGPLRVMSAAELRAALEPDDLVIGPGRSLLEDLPDRPLAAWPLPDATGISPVSRPSGRSLIQMTRELVELGRFADTGGRWNPPICVAAPRKTSGWRVGETRCGSVLSPEGNWGSERRKASGPAQQVLKWRFCREAMVFTAVDEAFIPHRAARRRERKVLGDSP